MIITANRVIHCNTELPEEMHHWISLLQKPKGDAKVEGQEFLVRGRSCIQTRFCIHTDAEGTLFYSFDFKHEFCLKEVSSVVIFVNQAGCIKR